MPRSTEFRRWTASHAGVFTRAVALQSGVSPKAFRRGAESGEWVRLGGAWILADFPRGVESDAWAALLRAGGDARLTGLTCLWMHGLRLESRQVYLSVPASRNLPVEGAVLLRDRKREASTFQVCGFPSVSRQRAVVDALRVADLRAGRQVLHEALRLGWVSCQQLERACEELKRHRGLVNLKAQARYAATGSHAESERILLGLLRAGGLRGWVLNVPVHASSGTLIGIGDCVNVDLRIVLEVDGMAWHSSADRFQRDRSRQNALVNAGWLVLRFTWADLTERPDTVLAEVRLATARREAG